MLRVIGDSSVVGIYNWGRLDSRGKRIRPQSEWIPMPVDRIVEDELFEMAQSLRDRDPGRNSGRLSRARSSWRGSSAARVAAIPASSKAQVSWTLRASPIAITTAADSAEAAKKPAPVTELRPRSSKARS